MIQGLGLQESVLSACTISIGNRMDFECDLHFCDNTFATLSIGSHSVSSARVNNASVHTVQPFSTVANENEA